MCGPARDRLPRHAHRSLAQARQQIAQQLLFTELHGMQTRYSDEKAVRPSVCLSVCQTREL